MIRQRMPSASAIRVARSRPLVAAVAVVAAAHAARGQCVNPFLPTSASTRALAMGDANTAGRDDDVIFYGPAQLAVARGTSAAIGRYGEHVTSATLASSARIATGGVGVGASLVTARNGVGCSMVVFTSPGSAVSVPAPLTFSRSLVVVGAAQTYKRFRVGVAGKYAVRQLGDARTTRGLADLGVARDISLGDNLPLGLALAVQNIGASAADETALQTPLRAAFGVAGGTPAGPLDIGIAGQLAVERYLDQPILRHGRVKAAAGLDVGYTWLDGYSISLRAGVRDAPTMTDLRQLTAGAGLALDRVAIDYALEQLVGSRVAHRVGLRLR